jgi:ABC-type tungstate transport system substrate-binding protein
LTLSYRPSRRALTHLNLLLPRLRHPAQFVVVGFAVAVAVGTLLLLPISRRGPGGADLVDALFTATSAVCVIGLVTVNTPVYWSGFGQAVILGLI